ncbi:MAG: RHS repeat-associated core domain-containing protein [Burkholderiales bacterium]
MNALVALILRIAIASTPARTRRWFRGAPAIAFAIVSLAFALLAVPAIAEVRLPNGEYTETTEDLRVKVLGGYVSVARTWTNSRWYVNPAWADLQFTYDSLDGSVKAIDRAGSIYERSGNSIYIFEKRFFIKNTGNGWRWYDAQGNWITYDTTGHLTAYGDRNNVQVSFQLDANGQRTQALDHFNNAVLTFQYSGTQLSAITDRVGRRVQYQYTGGLLTRVIDVLGNAWTYTYDGNGQVTSRTDPEGRTTTIVYAQSAPAGPPGPRFALPKTTAAAIFVSSTGPTPRDFKVARVFKVIDAENGATTYQYAYDRVTRQYTVTQNSPAGRQVVGVYDSEGRLKQQFVAGQLISSLTRDGDRIEIVVDERGLTTRTEYDGARNPLKITYPDGATVVATYNSVFSNVLSRTDEAGVTTNYQYDGKGNLLTMTEAVGLPEQRITTYTYDQYGQPITATRKGAAANADASFSYAYDALGNVTTITDPEGGVTRLDAYDAIGNVLDETNARGIRTTYTYNAAGWLLNQTDAAGLPEQILSALAYDKVGNITGYTDPRNNTERYAYDKRDLLTRMIDPYGKQATATYDADRKTKQAVDEDGHVRDYAFDQRGRLTQLKDGNGNAVNLIYAATIDEFPFGAGPLKVLYPTYSREFRYDTRNRVVFATAVQGQEGLVTSYKYDPRGLVVEQTDPNGHTIFYEYDALRRLVRVTDRINAQVAFTYDTRGNVTSIRDARGNLTTIGYDRLDRITGQTNPLGQARTYKYDGVGNVLEKLDARGHKVAFTYDGLDRKRTVQSFPPGAVSPSETWQFGYDANDNLVSWTNGNESGTLAYDNDDRKQAESVNYGAFQLGYAYSYTPGGQTATYTGPDGVTISYSYDQQEELTQVDIPGEGSIKLEDWVWRKPRLVTLPGGVTQTLSFDGFQKLASLSIKNPAQQIIADFRNHYGTLEETIARTIDGSTTGLAYDPEQRLTTIGGPTVESFQLDPAGNRTVHSAVAGTLTYNANNQLQQRGAANYQYDEAGNLVLKVESGITTRYRYDSFNRLVQIEDGVGTILVRYGYDPFDRRLWKDVGGQRTYFLHSDEGLAAEAAGTGQLQAIYGWEPQTASNTAPLFIKRAGTYGYIHYDEQGTPQRVTDKSGALIWSARYNPFGRATVDAQSTLELNLRLPGQYFDVETGLHYNDRRYYDPDTGRYLSEDPISFDGGLNLYAYASGDPVNRIDPTGEFAPLLPMAGQFARCFLICAAINAVVDPCAPFSDCAWDCIPLPFPRTPKFGPCNSFSPDTLVHTAEGVKPIDQVRLGESVLSLAEWKGETSYQPVADIVTSNREQLLVRLTLDDGETITATGGHPLHTPDGWRAAQLLLAGGQLDLKGRDGETRRATIVAVEHERKTVRVFNLEVANTHTFFVGEEGVLAHNGRANGGAPPSSFQPFGKGGSPGSGGGSQGGGAGHAVDRPSHKIPGVDPDAGPPVDGGQNASPFGAKNPNAPGTAGRRVDNRPIKRDWENKYGKKWPIDPDTGWKQDAHHINPLGLGGAHHVDNIEPLTRKDHINVHKARRKCGLKI